MREYNQKEIYYDVELAIDYAFNGHFILKFYDYLKIRGSKRSEVDEFTESVTANNITFLVNDLSDYIQGGSDSEHKFLREAYGHIPKPQARKIKKYLQDILKDASRYSHDRRPGRRKKRSK